MAKSAFSRFLRTPFSLRHDIKAFINIDFAGLAVVPGYALLCKARSNERASNRHLCYNPDVVNEEKRVANDELPWKCEMCKRSNRSRPGTGSFFRQKTCCPATA